MRVKQGSLILLLFLSVFLCRGQESAAGYAARWKVVDSLINKKGLTQSALDAVNAIYAMARQEKNDPETIRALVYRLGLMKNKAEDVTQSSIQQLEKEIDVSRPPARSILQQMLAGVYMRYIQENLWKLTNRTNTEVRGAPDFETWSLDELNQKVRELFLASLQDENLLSQTSLSAYEPVIIRGNSSHLRPGLFDLLAHNALTYFLAGEAFAGRYTRSYTTRDTALFDDAEEFASRQFRTDDTLAFHFQALLLYQRLIRRHLNDKDKAALMDVDIERIETGQLFYIGENAKELYRKALRRLTDRYDGVPAADEAWYLQAEGYALDATNQEDSNGNVKAKAICERVLSKSDSSGGQAHCATLLHTILQQELNLRTEAVNIPFHPFRSLVSWRNFSRLYLRLVRTDGKAGPQRVNLYDSDYLNRLLRMPVYRSAVQQLPETGDYREHRVEIGLPSLPPGEYVLLGSTDSGWSRNKGVITAGTFTVSIITYMNQGEDYFVLNRENGRPLAGATVQIWERAVNSRNAPEMAKTESYRTDENGHFGLKKKVRKDLSIRRLEISIPGDHLFPLKGGYAENYPGEIGLDRSDYETDERKCFLFTDRSIYRPGQTVYFKGILVTKDFDTQRAKLLSQDSCKVTLLNASGEAIDSIQVVTNEFGSYHGSFRLPEGQLNGTFSINNNPGEGTTDFSVEEYKRPKFYVGIDKQRGSYRIGDTIRVKGAAKAYAGNAIGGGKVSYTVVRTARFPQVWQMQLIRTANISEREIAHGQTTTDAEGRFAFVFPALADREINRGLDPEFEYAVSVDVTDVNGETRTGSADIMAGFNAFRLSIHFPGDEAMPADSFRSVVVSAGNLSGEPVGADIHVMIYPLKAPQRLIRTRLWPAPDRYLWSEKEWLDSFPHDEYREENEKDSWEKGEKIWEGKVSTSGEGGEAGQAKLSVPSGLLRAGWYLIEARSADRYGQEVKEMQYAELYDGKTGRPGNPQYNWSTRDKVTASPGESVTTAAGSSADVYVIRAVQRRNEGLTNQFAHFTLNGEKKNTGWAITEADRGGFGVLDAWVRDNRLYTHLSMVRVPWTNKELEIHYSTFRDKNEPGKAEKWAFKITGPTGEKASAEVMTAMYDASLDQFRENDWSVPGLYSNFMGGQDWTTWNNFNAGFSESRDLQPYRPVYYQKSYDRLLQPGDVLRSRRMMVAGRRYEESNPSAPTLESGDIQSRGIADFSSSSGYFSKYERADSIVMAFDGASPGKAGAPAPGEPAGIQARKDFRETAFFLPDLRTDRAGNVSFSFTMPEAVTSWKWMTLAHTRDLAFGYGEKTVITQKELMVQPNAPRFLREGDRMELPVKVVNLTDSEMTGQMSLELTDPTTGETADGWFVNRQANQYFTVGAKQSVVVGFPLDIPYQYNRPLTYKVVAQAGNYSDGEEATLPVVSNRLLVTESLPLTMSGDGTKHFVFDKLAKSGSSETLNHHALTVEFTTNPAWYAVQSLPYLMEYPYECSEQTFERLYANALATRIAGGSPRLQQVFNRWRVADTAQLLSNLQKNQELKTVLLEETPWVMQGKSEAQQKKRIALLFDMHRMSGELASALDRLRNMQSTDGAFPWWSGGPDNRYITQYILTGIGHLQRLNAVPPDLRGKLDSIIASALPYLDMQIRKDYEEARAAEVRAAKSGKTVGPPILPIGSLAVHYLYMRSLFPNHGLPGSAFAAVNYFRKKAQHDWVRYSPYLQGMIALALYRTGDIQTAKDIMASLKQNAIRDPEQGMYWKGMQGGYYWYQAPVETESLLIEAFHEISGDAGIDTELKTWLLKQKQTHSWATTTATADACYALLIGNRDWLNVERSVEVRLGDKTIDWGPGEGDAGAGYHKKVFDGPFVNPSMGNVTVTVQTKGGGGSPAWGAVYWQYFDMLDRITPPGGSKPALSVSKKLFIRRDTDRGPVLEPLSDNGELKPGDRVVARIEVRADRDMEYVHLKDMRAACLEPVNVISQYKWQDGLGYYESTKDAGTDFFFDVVPRGTYVLEYELLAGQSGNFSNGISTIQCLYAPEFTYHTEGIRLNVETGN